jgi:hypothetical protein
MLSVQFSTSNSEESREASKPESQRVKGIEPSCAAWEAAVLPLNYTRILEEVNSESFRE